MGVPLFDLSRQHQAIMPALREQVLAVLESGQYILGPAVESFESQLAAYSGAEHAVGVSSGTDALLAAMMAADIGPGDQVITSAFTFFATGGCIARLGAAPVFVDIEPASFNLDAELITPAVTEHTKAIMPVHLFGLPADVQAISRIARENNLVQIDDAAQAIGVSVDGKPLTDFGLINCLSFFPTKNLGGMGDAGACLTNDDELAQRLRELRMHGQSGPYEHAHIGGNFRIDAMQAALLSVKLPHLDDYAAARRAHAAVYAQAFADLPVVCPGAGAGAGRHHVYNQYTLRVPDGQRDPLLAHLQKRAIGCRVYYPKALHLQPCFASLGYQPGSLPITEQATREVLSLPIYPELPESDQQQVIDAVRGFFQ